MKEEIEIEIENGDERKLLKHLIREVRNIHQFLERHFPGKPESATLTLQNPNGGNTMPATVAVGQSATELFLEWTGPNGTGSNVQPLVSNLSFVSDNPAVATVDNTTIVAAQGGITVQCMGVSAGVANISGADSSNQLTASDALTVSGSSTGTAVSATASLSANPLPSSRSRF
jgi:hypothetical protein